MATNLKLGLLEWSDKQFHLLKVYLPYVVILTMGYWIMKQSDQMELMRKEHNEHLENDLKFARETYQRSQEAMFLIMNHKN